MGIERNPTKENGGFDDDRRTNEDREAERRRDELRRENER